MDHPAIETSGLTRKFGRAIAVDSLDLSVPQASVFGFLGLNGAGKTTTIRMLLGLVQPTSGTGTILGKDIVRERSQFLSKVGAVVETPAAYPFLSGYENLLVIARAARIKDRGRIQESLRLVGLGERSGQKVKGYSLGMKQRLAIASALLNDPEVTFLDEPTNGLDPAGAAEVRELIKTLRAEGRTIFLSSHLLHEVEQLCTNVAIIHRGRLLTAASIESLLRQDLAG